MRIRLQQSDAARIEIDLPHPDGRPRTICLTDLRDASGGIERVAGGPTGGETRVRGVRASSAVLDRFDWPLPRGGRLSATSPSGLAGVSLELDAPDADRRAVSGRAALTRASAKAVAIDLGRSNRLALDIDCRAGAIELSPERIGYASAERLDLGNIQTALAGWLVRVSSAALQRARADWQGGATLIGAAAAQLGGATVTGGGITAEIDRVELPEGLRTSGRSLVVPRLVVPEARVAVDDLTAAFAERTRRPAPADRPATESGRFHFDFGFLDRVTGRLDVDLTMELTVPVIGKREATHHFRVPIVGGAVNYRDLEHDLASIEDAFIDLEVRGKSLVLERRIPLLGLEKPLVIWELTAEELELAKRRLVRLRTVPRMQLVRSGGSDKSPIAVRRMRFAGVEIELALAPSEAEKPDAIGRMSVANLKARGELQYEPQRDAPPTRAELAIERISGGPFEVAAGPLRVEVEGLEVGAAEGQVEFAGLRPRGAKLVARAAVLRNLKIALPAVLAALVAAGCGGDDDSTFTRADARPPPDGGPLSDARLGVDCMGADCRPDQTCCRDQLEPPYFTFLCVPDGQSDDCEGSFDCDGPEDCPSGLCCGGTRIECAPEGATTCSEGATVCHRDEECGGGQCCPTPTGVVRECVGPC